MSMSRAVLVRAALVVILAGVLTGACEKAQLLAPTASTLTLTSGVTLLTGSGSTVITAFVAEKSGTPVQNGTTVRFTTTLGRLEQSEAQTRNGAATTTLFAEGAPGVAVVTAASGSAVASGTGATGTALSITMGSAAVESVTLAASPATVSSTGGTVTLTATVFATGNRLLPGVPVAFSTTTGTLSSSTVTTSADGTAVVTMATNRAATVTAVVGTKTATAAITVTTPPSLTLATTPTAPLSGQPVTLTVTPGAAAAGTAPAVTVTWGDGTSSSPGVVTAARSATHTYSSPGSYTITATATEGAETFSTAISVTIAAPPPPLSVTLSVNVNTGVTGSTGVPGVQPTLFVFTVTPAGVTSTTPQGVGARSVVLDFGDGESISLGTIAAATVVTHRYTTVGTYTVRVTQVDILGNVTTAVVVITVTANATS